MFSEQSGIKLEPLMPDILLALLKNRLTDGSIALESFKRYLNQKMHLAEDGLVYYEVVADGLDAKQCLKNLDKLGFWMTDSVKKIFLSEGLYKPSAAGTVIKAAVMIDIGRKHRKSETIRPLAEKLGLKSSTLELVYLSRLFLKYSDITAVYLSSLYFMDAIKSYSPVQDVLHIDTYDINEIKITQLLDSTIWGVGHPVFITN